MSRDGFLFMIPVVSYPTKVTVPEGHEVRAVGGSLIPSVHRLEGGLLVATTGAAGDDHLAEVSQLLSEVERQSTPCKVIASASAVRLQDLFAPAAPATETFESAALVFFQRGSCVGWTDEALGVVATRLQKLARRVKLFICVEPSHELSRVKLSFESEGLGVTIPAHDGTVAVEVRRPDRTIITALTNTSPDARVLAESARMAVDVVLQRSPQLNALLLAIVQDNNARTRSTLESYLEVRTAPFALIASQGADGQYGISPRSFPGMSAFVAYGDERALHGAAHALGMPPGGYAMAALLPRKLFCMGLIGEYAVADLCVRGSGRPDEPHVARPAQRRGPAPARYCPVNVWPGRRQAVGTERPSRGQHWAASPTFAVRGAGGAPAAYDARPSWISSRRRSITPLSSTCVYQISGTVRPTWTRG